MRLAMLLGTIFYLSDWKGARAFDIAVTNLSVTESTGRDCIEAFSARVDRCASAANPRPVTSAARVGTRRRVFAQTTALHFNKIAWACSAADTLLADA